MDGWPRTRLSLSPRLLTVVDCCLNLAKINKAIQQTNWGPKLQLPSPIPADVHLVLGVRKVLSLAKLTFRTPNENEIVFFSLATLQILQLLFTLPDVLDS